MNDSKELYVLTVYQGNTLFSEIFDSFDKAKVREKEMRTEKYKRSVGEIYVKTNLQKHYINKTERKSNGRENNNKSK